MNLKPFVLGLLAIALLSGIANVFLSVKFVTNHRKLQAQVGAIQQGMASQQFLMNLLNQLGPYVQKDQGIIPILQKYGIGFNPNGNQQPR
ncbi:hypothetical protein QQ056_01870 [Oscillatoria laete-virens NRMC-F 0139]|nr:hypothetical protein [Oscillatoria laete-virens]MDL5052316.1 hypothetical protein [Oscillatoria laete-virens NRMC-F 0139]